MLQTGLRSGWLVASVLFVAAGAHAGQILYGITNDDNLITIDTATGAGTLVGTPGIAMNSIGIGADAGQLYVFDSFDSTNQGLRQINPTTAAVSAVISVGISSYMGEGDITYDTNGSRWLFGSTALSDGSFDPVNGSLFSYAGGPATVVGTTLKFDGLAFGAGGVLFGLDQTGDSIYTINPTTANGSLLGSTGLTTVDSGTGFPLYGFGGMAYSGTQMYAVLSNYSDSFLYRINTATGQGTPIGSGIGFAQVSGLAFLGAPAPPTVPEPGTLVLTAAVGVLWIFRRKRT